MTNYMQPVLIELNTREIRDGLRALGYEVVYIDECPENYGWATGAGHAVILRPEQFDYWTTSVPTAKRINCGKNIDLFLALAALRNDNTNHQWFIVHTPCYPNDYVGKMVYNYCGPVNSEYIRKATTEELIKYFS